MPIFSCSRCEVIENTALVSYWYLTSQKEKPLCSECETGSWHGLFKKKKPDASWFVYDKHFLCGPSEIENFKHMGPLRHYRSKSDDNG
jgi:hypothetical protein